MGVYPHLKNSSTTFSPDTDDKLQFFVPWELFYFPLPFCRAATTAAATTTATTSTATATTKLKAFYGSNRSYCAKRSDSKAIKVNLTP